MKRSPLELAELWAGEPEPAPRVRDIVAAVVVFVVFPVVMAATVVGAYLAVVSR